MAFLRRGTELERRLRAERPAPSEELVERIEARVADERAPLRSGGRFRVAVPAALTAAMIAALAAVGGVGYAASSVKHAVNAVAHVVAPAKSHSAISVLSLSAGGDQYRPGYGFGDPNHNHTGPPGLHRGPKGGAFAPPISLKPSGDGKAMYLNTNFTVDEQAHLTLSIFGPNGKLLLTQRTSKVGSKVTGPQTKNIQYLVLVPRALPLQLRIPANLVTPGQTYYVRIRARDPQGNVTFLRIPFSA